MQIRGAMVMQRYACLPAQLDEQQKLANPWLRKWEECLRLLKPCTIGVYQQVGVAAFAMPPLAPPSQVHAALRQCDWSRPSAV